MLNVLTLSTLFPDATRPNFGMFVARQTLALAQRAGVRVRVVAPLGLPPTPLRTDRHRALAALPRVERWEGLEVHRPRFLSVPGSGGRWHAALLARALAPLVAELAAAAPIDVIDAQFFFPDGPAATVIGARLGLPVSIKARGSDIHYWGPRRQAQIVAAGRQAAGLLAVSAAMKADMAALGLPAARIAVHHTGVALDRFVPVDRVAAKAALGVTGPLVVALGALSELKGHDLVIDALATLPQATLLIVGEGPARAALAARAAPLGERVRLTGAVPHEQLPALLAAADVMALASAREGLANAWIESLACGVPIVIPDVGGAREVVTSPAFGRIVPRTAEGFAGAIAALLADPPSPQAVRGGAARFTWEANATALHAHLAACAGRHEALAA